MDCKVTILCITYNQEKYISEAIESFLLQKTSFDYEILIHDDASTDNTVRIIREYCSKYPKKIKLLTEAENLYSKGEKFINSIITDVAQGDYIAFCEGDDYWTANDKLQLQYEALEKHTDCDMCACWGSTITEDGTKEISQIRPANKSCVLKLDDVILGGGQFLVTAGLFFRRQMCFDMMGMDSLDYSLQIRGAVRGGIYYLDHKMAVYRRYAKGSWTNSVLNSREKLQIQWEKEKKLLASFDEYTQKEHHEVIEKRINSYVFFDEQLEDNYEEISTILKQCMHPCFIWGYGRRGKSLEAFLLEKGLGFDGICDAINDKIGGQTELGSKIYHTEYVLDNAAVILASTEWAYKDLIKLKNKVIILNFQKYMPIG